MAILNTRIKRLLGRLVILAIFTVLIDTSWILYRASTIPINATTSESIAAHEEEQKPRVFISSAHWNTEIILRSYWHTALVQLVQSLGPENVYVSIIESGSWDGTKDALRDLDDALGQMGVKRTISLSDTTHLDEVARGPNKDEGGWIYTPRGREEPRRIPYLSKQRNDSLKPLVSLEKNLGLKYDKILFLNDVAFTVRSLFFSLSFPCFFLLVRTL